MKPSSFNTILEKYNKIYSKDFPYSTKFDNVLSNFLLEQEDLTQLPTAPIDQSVQPGVPPPPAVNISPEEQTGLPSKDLKIKVKMVETIMDCLNTDIDSLIKSREDAEEIRKIRSRLDDAKPDSSSDSVEIMSLISKILEKNKAIKNKEFFAPQEIEEYEDTHLIKLAHNALLTSKEDLDNSVSHLKSEANEKLLEIKGIIESGNPDFSKIEKLTDEALSKLEEIISGIVVTDYKI